MNESHEYGPNDGGQSLVQYHYHYHYYHPEADLPGRTKQAREKGESTNPIKAALRSNANIVCGGLLILIAISIVGYIIPDLIIRARMNPNQYVQFRHVIEQVVSMYSDAVSFIVALIVIKAWLKIPAKAAFPINRKDFSITIPAIFICLGINVLGGYAYGIISAITDSVFGVVSGEPDFSLPVGTAAIVVYSVSMTVLPAVLEEILFRGVIMQSLRRFGDGFALMASSLLFGLFHGNFAQFIPAFLAGLAIGYFVLRTGSIFTGIIIHFVNNGSILLVSLITNSGSEQLIRVTNIVVSILCLGLGVISAVFLLWRSRGIFQLACPKLQVKRRKKYFAFFTSVAAIGFLLVTIAMTALYFV